MNTPLHRDTRLDDLDAEQFERMLGSKSWQIYSERLALMWDQASTRCLTENDEMELRRAQGAAVAIQSAMAVPKTILQELRQPATKRVRRDE